MRFLLCLVAVVVCAASGFGQVVSRQSPRPFLLPRAVVTAQPPEKYLSLYPGFLRPFGIQRIDVVFGPPLPQARRILRPFRQ